MPKRRITYNAPVLSVDLIIDGEIWPCPQCLPWHVEILTDTDPPLAREWHAVDCPLLIELLQQPDEET